MFIKLKTFIIGFSVAVISLATPVALVDKDFRDDYALIVQAVLSHLISSADSQDSEDGDTHSKK